MYLCVNDKSYNVTSEYNKPYMKVNGSILPLTTNGGGLIHCKDNNGNTYRPMTYGPMSTSYYTTSNDSSGIYSVTALTERSTTGTSYETEESIRNMSLSYRTSHTHSYSDLEAGIEKKSYLYVYNGSLSRTSINTGTALIQTTQNYTNVYNITVTRKTYYVYGNNISYSSTSNGASNSNTTNSTQFIYTHINNGTSTLYSGYGSNRGSITSISTRISTTDYDGVLYVSQQLYVTRYNNATHVGYEDLYVSLTSGTAYTQTTNTIYLTSEVTTAYSGIYSSVQSGSSTWYTSAEVSEGMYDTTALTRESTSGTSYLTSTQKGSTGYRIVDYIVNSRRDIYQTQERIYTGTMLNYFTITNVNYHAVGIRIYNSTYGSNAPYLTTYGTEYRTTNGSSTSGSRIYSTNNYSMTWSWTFIRNDAQTNILTLWLSSVNAKQIATDGPVSTSLTYLAAYSSSVSLNITASQYGDTTITSGTSYLTCESTSGYSGISSSSSIAYGWQ